MFKFHSRWKFRREFSRAVADGVLTNEKRRQLAVVGNELGIEQSYADDVRRKHFAKAIAPIKAEIVQTRRMSADQENALQKLARDLNVTIGFDRFLDMARELWAWEHGEEVHLAPLDDAPILLGKGEVCCLVTPAVWQQIRTTRTRVGYSGTSMSFRIMRGMSYRLGNIKPIYSTSEGLAEIARGHFCLTNKKIAFVSDRRSTTITHGRILDLDVYTDALEIRKSSGKPDVFLMDRLAAEFAYMALNEMNRQQ